MDTLFKEHSPEVSIESEMKRAYLDYAMSVIIGRALPDVRDGLKPVHRRVLFAMHELKNDYNKPYKKSARVVGDCFVKGTLVHTERGLRPIEAIEAGDQVLLPDGSLSRVSQSFHNPNCAIVRVEMQNGYCFRVTPGQLFRVLNPDLSVGWERAENLAGRTVLVSHPRALGVPTPHPDSEATALAYLMGLMVAEGYLTEGINRMDPEPLIFVFDYCKRHNITPYWREVKPQKAHYKAQHGVRFSQMLPAYEAGEARCMEKTVPDWILADRRLFAPFIAGFTDGDGHVRTKDSRREILFASSSEPLMVGFQAMLADSGIHAMLAREDFKTREYGQNHLPRYNLWLVGEPASQLCDQIKDFLLVPRKRENAEAMSQLGSELSPPIPHLMDHYNLMPVQSVCQESRREDTYDIRIESPEHEFLAQGFAVHNCIGKYHPHGDMAVYDTIVRLTQDFSMRYPLVDGQGNFGSIDGDSAAAMRYTEVRMAKIAHQMLADLEKETVDFTVNYDESLTEPTVLPANLPCLLANGAAGIAVGMATNIPPHNLSELCTAIQALIDNPQIRWQELMEYLPGPDFPTGGIIYGTKGIREAYQSGRGIIRIRARIQVEKDKRTGKETIVATELPYQVNKARLIEKIANLVKTKVIEGISYVRDESDRQGMRVAIGLKKDQMAEVIINHLYKHTQMENSFGIIFLAVLHNRPRLFGLKELLEQFVVHRKEIITRRTRHDLKKARERAHILEGLKIALDNLDAVVALIRKAKNGPEAKAQLMAAYQLTDVQAQAILDMRLQRLTGLEREKIVSEYEQVLKDIARFEEILASERQVLQIIKTELEEIKQEYGDDRRTRIAEETRELTIEDMIVEEDMAVTVTNAGYIKRTPISQYQSQRRGGKGKTAMGTKDEDFVSLLFVASTHHTFMFFTNRGKVYWCKVYEIPQAGRASRGKAIVNLLDFEPGERLTTVMPVKEFEPGYYVLMATKHGMIKKTDIMAYSRPRAGGIIALTLAEGDELIAARISDGTQNIFLGSAGGKSIRFQEADVRATGRTAQGVRGMNLPPDDYIVGMEVLSYGRTLFAATENGFGKRTSVDEYPVQRRGGKGVITIKTSKRNGLVQAILLVDDDDELMLMTDRGKLIRMSVAGINVISRNTQGVKLMDMEASERLVGAARLAEKENGEEE